MFAIKRERGEGQATKVEAVEDGKKYNYLANGDYELANVSIKSIIDEDNKLQVGIEGPVNKKQIKNEIGKYISAHKTELQQKGINYKCAIKKLHSELDKNWKDITNNTKPFKSGIIKFECAFGGIDIALSILKILFFFFKETKKNVQINDDDIIDILKNKSIKIWERCFYYSLKEPLFDEIPNEISHFICVKGYKEKKIIGYVKLFSVTPYVCILEDNYNGEDFTISYGFNLLSQQSFTPKCNCLIDIDNLKERLDYKTNFEITSKNIENDFSRIMELYYKLNPKKKWTEIQYEVDKKIREQVGNEIANTPLFQDAIKLLDSGEYYHFTENVTPQNKNQIIIQLANIIIVQLYNECLKQNKQINQ